MAHLSPVWHWRNYRPALEYRSFLTPSLTPPEKEPVLRQRPLPLATRFATEGAPGENAKASRIESNGNTPSLRSVSHAWATKLEESTLFMVWNINVKGMSDSTVML